jgi:hypothetical protein
MGGSPQGRGERVVLALALGACVGLAVACASPVSLADGRFRSRSSGASVADLTRLEAGWRSKAVAGALLAFEATDGARTCWIRRCPGAAAPARAEARAALISLEDVAVQEEGPLTLAGAEAWQLRATASERGRAVELRLVTRVAEGCTDDFWLVSPGPLAVHEPAFEAWWGSFEAPRPG